MENPQLGTGNLKQFLADAEILSSLKSVPIEDQEEPKPRQDFNARITVVSNFYHQCKGENPTNVPIGYSRHTKIVEQPYIRWQRSDSEWKPLDLGWLKDRMSLLLIQNDEKPLKNELELGEEHIIELSYDKQSSWLIPPGEAFQGLPGSSGLLFVRSIKPCKFTVYGFPA